MPLALPEGFGDVTNAGSAGFTPIRGIFEASIFKIDKKSSKRKDKKTQQEMEAPYYSITFRINEGEFDGEDIPYVYVGLYSDAIFTLHNILVGLGELDTYYKKGEGDAKGQWVALPDVEDLQGKKLYIQVDNAPWQSTDRETKVGILNAEGKPELREGNGISAYYPISEPKPAYKPRKIRENLARVQPTTAGVVGGSAFPGQVTGLEGNVATNDVWGSGPSQPGTAGTTW